MTRKRGRIGTVSAWALIASVLAPSAFPQPAGKAASTACIEVGGRATTVTVTGIVILRPADRALMLELPEPVCFVDGKTGRARGTPAKTLRIGVQAGKEELLPVMRSEVGQRITVRGRLSDDDAQRHAPPLLLAELIALE